MCVCEGGGQGGFTLYMKLHQKLNRKTSPQPLSTWWCEIQFGADYPFKAERNEDDESSLCNMQCSFQKTKYRRFEDPAMIRSYLILGSPSHPPPCKKTEPLRFPLHGPASSAMRIKIKHRNGHCDYSACL